MNRWISAPIARLVGVLAAGGGGGLLLWLDDVREHDAAWTALVAWLLLVALVATWAALRTKLGWIGVGAYALSVIAVAVAFAALLGVAVAGEGSTIGEIVAVTLPAAAVGHVFLALAIAFRQEFTALSTLAFVAAGVLFIVTAAWTPAYAIGWLCWAGGLGVEAIFELTGRGAVRAARARVFS